jgi:hypothetical protein
MRGRIHLGATYYYFWSLPAWFGDDPRLAYGFAALLGVAAVAATYVLGRELVGPRTGRLAALLLATSPAAVLDSRIAWAPAAIPPLTALLLLLVHALLRRVTSPRAMATAATAALATQLHLATAPLLAVAAGGLLARSRRLGVRGLAFATLAGLLPLAPMALAWRLDAGAEGPAHGDVRERPAVTASAEGPAPHAEPDGRDPTRGRIADLIAVGGRTLEGYTEPPGERSALVSLWIAVERLALPVAIAAALLVAVRTARGAHRAVSPVPELATFALALGAVAVLPTEAWYYYLDTALVPGCVLLAVAATTPGARFATPLRLVLLAAAAIRTIGLLAWIASAHSTGVVRANLELLRIGGSDETQLDGRARLPTVAVKQAAAAFLAREIGGPTRTLRERVHGTGFADLDTDNGYFFQRAGRAVDETAVASMELAGSVRGKHALAVYGGELPPEWTDRFEPARRAGPLAIYSYAPSVRADSARISGCSETTSPPARPLADPRDYGFGQPDLPRWPCAPGPIEIDVPLDATPVNTTVRVFARMEGAGRVLQIASDPPGEPVVASAPGAGAGIVLPANARRLRLGLVVDGPAALDLYELHGRAGRDP